MTQEPANRICDHCKPFIEAFVCYTQDLDQQIQLIADLCLAVNSDGEVGRHCVGGIGNLLREYIDKQDVAKNYFFGTAIGSELCDEALVKAERVRIEERFKFALN